MIDLDTIHALTEPQAIAAAQLAVSAAISLSADDTSGVLALPNHFTLHDIEARLPMRRRARGVMTTLLLPDFAVYAHAHQSEGAAVFVDAERMSATAVLNLGTPEAPGHADDLAVYKPPTTAAYDAMQAMLTTPMAQRRHSQRTLAEWMEDWAAELACTDADGKPLATPQAIAAVRAITVEAARKAESVEGPLSAERSSFESVKASSRNTLPAHVQLTCAPYTGMDARAFRLRVSVHPEDKGVTLTLRLAQAEWHREQMAAELAHKVRDAMASALPVVLGTYVAR